MGYPLMDNGGESPDDEAQFSSKKKTQCSPDAVRTNMLRIIFMEDQLSAKDMRKPKHKPPRTEEESIRQLVEMALKLNLELEP